MVTFAGPSREERLAVALRAVLQTLGGQAMAAIAVQLAARITAQPMWNGSYDVNTHLKVLVISAASGTNNTNDGVKWVKVRNAFSVNRLWRFKATFSRQQLRRTLGVRFIDIGAATVPTNGTFHLLDGLAAPVDPLPDARRESILTALSSMVGSV